MRLLVSLFAVLAVSGPACAQSLPSQPSPTGLQHPDLAQQSAVYVKVQLGKPVKVSALTDQTQSNNAEPATAGGRNGGPCVTLEAANPARVCGEGFALPGRVTLAAGTMAKIILLGWGERLREPARGFLPGTPCRASSIGFTSRVTGGDAARRNGCEEHTSASVEPGRFAFACVHGSDVAGEYKHSGAGVGHHGGARPKVAHQD
jgi:hypothetical protein